eukprot:TRINITY_DN33885_c0_g1_i1.p1 TRINITY_DN33885_c0_g1~~TRINITY_DN33885_c0_g1_i1.p1  ORF type:complete len:137 (+),score=11.40 TRINITY_DN33885_c0_g1_i1:74-484(+)
MSRGGEGPYPLFVSRADLPVGYCLPLTFFEPRYRFMCRELLAAGKPYYFGWVTSGRAAPGNIGVLCEMRDLSGGTEVSESFDGTFEVAVCAVSRFTLLEVSRVPVPSGPNFPDLSVGYVSFTNPPQTTVNVIIPRG